MAGACYPECHPDSANRTEDIKFLKEKADAGAEILLSQLFFDNQYFYDFLGECRNAGITIPVTPGIMPVTNAAQIQRMICMCGASLPESLQKILSKYGNDHAALAEAGIDYAVEQISDLLAKDVDGIHLYTMNNPAVAKKICDKIRHLI